MLVLWSVVAEVFAIGFHCIYIYIFHIHDDIYMRDPVNKARTSYQYNSIVQSLLPSHMVHIAAALGLSTVL